MPSIDDTANLRRKLTHAEAVIAELRGLVAELRKQIEAQQAHVHRLLRISFGRGGERVEGPTLFDSLDSEPDLPPAVAVESPITPANPRPKQRGHGAGAGSQVLT